MKRITPFLLILAIIAKANSQNITTTYSYSWKYDTTYNSQNGTKNYSYTGTVQTFNATAGTYTLEVWGAQGGMSGHCTTGYGKGGYAKGTLTLTASAVLYIHVGGQGSDGTSSTTTPTGGWNGGGSGGTGKNDNAGAGGGTDISLNGSANGSTTWNTTNHLYSRVIVAGGGGGNGCSDWIGGVGGGNAGTQGSGGSSYSPGGYGGTQTSGGAAPDGTGVSGTFGAGANGLTGTSWGGGGGGGGWYGGATGTNQSGGASAGGGGSGYVYTSSTASNYPAGCLLNTSNYLTSAATYAGNTSFASTTGGTEVGHSGNGYAKITYSFTIIDHIDSSVNYTYVTTTISDEVCKNGSYNKYGFSVDGSTLSSGVHSYTNFTQTAGKDSTTILNLTIKPDVTTYIEIDAPYSYIWPINGETYTQSGIYEYTTVTADGCDSTVILALTIYDPTIGIEENTDIQDIIVTPNPAWDYIDIQKNSCDNTKLTIINTYGQVCLIQNISEKKTRVSLEKLPAGTYFLNFSDKSTIYQVKKLLIIK
ncbi:MAG: T9SS type A sorting domain-containing protein [Bacteroidales bacterium]|nr:T9SS type A sorting domain-containing protein [Bacteroidales bacterium]